MKQRLAKVNISSAGGSAAAGSKTCKVTLPTSWLNQMGIGPEQRQVVLSFDGERIVVSPVQTMDEFARERRKAGHKIVSLRYYDGDRLCTKICADFSDHMLMAENHTEDPVKTAFGRKALPDWEDLMSFLEERCVPRERAGLREYLEALGLDCYDPVEIVKKTQGRMAEDRQWLEVIS